ncbi:unnamed protein product, partial [Owenia fusiformis]
TGFLKRQRTKMVRDRLAEFKMLSALNRDGSFRRSLKNSLRRRGLCKAPQIDDELCDLVGDDTTGAQGESLNQTLLKITEVHSYIKSLKQKQKDLSKIYSDIISSPMPARLRQPEADSIKSACTGLIAKIQNLIIALNPKDKKAIAALGRSHFENRVVSTHSACLKKNLLDIVEKINASEVQYYEQQREKLVRQLSIAGKDTSDIKITRHLKR